MLVIHIDRIKSLLFQFFSSKNAILFSWYFSQTGKDIFSPFYVLTGFSVAFSVFSYYKNLLNFNIYWILMFPIYNALLGVPLLLISMYYIFLKFSPLLLSVSNLSSWEFDFPCEFAIRVSRFVVWQVNPSGNLHIVSCHFLSFSKH